MENREENLVKKTCRELGITQKELAKKIGVPNGTVNRWASTDDIPKMTVLALKLLMENRELKTGIEYITKGFSIFSKHQQKATV
ncbi:putative transcriptional regulator [Thiovulum sp. ES]|nr:putative transcriptional regulator [Thiovulum sp. ES]